MNNHNRFSISRENNNYFEHISSGDSWRMFRIMAEFVDGFDTMSAIERPAVTVYGSARTKEEHPDYQKARAIAHKLAETGYPIVTGGGPGIMEAANRGASEAGGISIGINIDIPHEQYVNKYINLPLDFRYFFVRKVMFMKYSMAFICMPGGFGSMDELFESLTLIQTHKVKPFPIILVGSSFWSGLLDWLKTQLLATGKISEKDLALIEVMDDVDEIVQHISRTVVF